MRINTRYRSTAPEIMDDFQMEGEILRDALDKIASINRLLGGNKVTIDGVKKLLKGAIEKNGATDHGVNNKVIRILDAGCGNGDMLRTLADFGRQRGLNFELTGLDANAFTVGHAESLSAGYPNISFRCADIFEAMENKIEYDIILCTLTLHHFSDAEILKLLAAFENKARLGVVINDLHRSALAYTLFKGLCVVFGLNYMSREDGLVSILRGFKRRDLRRYAGQLGFKNSLITWKWAFRYQWIIPSAGRNLKRKA